jgi:anti-sigma regulatory factor (Ser/Thr protein kinase)
MSSYVVYLLFCFGRDIMQSDSTVLGSLTIGGRPEQVRVARHFVMRTVSRVLTIDSDAATLLTSELVTNAIQHTRSGREGGTVTVVVVAVSDGVLVEVIDAGSPGIPVVKADLYAPQGHGLYLVQRLAAQWGYLRHHSGTTVWFHLPFTGGAARRAVPADTGQLMASCTAAMTPAQIAPRSSSPVT